MTGALAEALAEALRRRQLLDEATRQGDGVPAAVAVAVEREVREAEAALVRARTAGGA